MDRAFAYSILAVLFIAVHSSMAFLLNIHENMTRAERFAIFGSADSVPEYEVFHLPLSGARSKRKANQYVKLELVIDDRRITLELKPTKKYLATKYTPVWYAENDEHAYNKIRYDPLPKAMSDIGKFKMYHDVKNEAAVIIYDDPIQGSVMHGIVTAYYAIKSLPRSLMRAVLSNKPLLDKIRLWNKRSIISDLEEDQGYVVVYKIPNTLKDVKSRSLVHAENLEREKRSTDGEKKQTISADVYPKIFIVLDCNLDSKHNLTEILRFTLAFWNGVDLIYGTLREPKIYLNIAGIIIAPNVSTTPYMLRYYHGSIPFSSGFDLSQMGQYFYTERVRFPMDRYDMIIGMTELVLVHNNRYVHYVLGNNIGNADACNLTREASKTNTIENTGMVRYKFEYSEVRAAAKMIARILGVKDDMSNATNPDCNSEKGYIMAEFPEMTNAKMQWSDCSRRDFSRYFSSHNSLCLKKAPPTKQVGEVLPGSWLTLDGQCQNEGYAKACKLESSRGAKGCQAEGSSECVRSKRAPLLGSNVELTRSV